MIELEENKHKIIVLKEKLNSIGEALGISKLQEEIKKIKDVNQNVLFNQILVLEGAKSTIKLYNKELLIKNIIILFEALILISLFMKKINVFSNGFSSVLSFVKKIFK